MDSHFAGIVKDASQISESGRWACLNDVIVRYCNGLVLQDRLWHFQLFTSLWHAVSAEYLQLRKAHEEPTYYDHSLLAWRARNLLELRVLTAYSCRSVENARRIYEDAGRDGREMLKTFATWGESRDTQFDWSSRVAGDEAELLQKASEVGITNLDRPYKHVRDAAKDCGIAEDFAMQFKLFSKFAHPTAFQIVAPFPDGERATFRDAFLSGGCGSFVHAFTSLEQTLHRVATYWTTHPG